MNRPGALTRLNLRAAALVVCFGWSAVSQARTFDGNDCTEDCSGHAAGYKWAEEKGVTNSTDCPLNGNATSFQEGCVSYTEDPSRGSDKDDDGADVDE